MSAAEAILNALERQHYYEFAKDGERYLIQPDNNKGCDYLSLWRMGEPPVRLRQAVYDIFDGIDAETVEELISGFEF